MSITEYGLAVRRARLDCDVTLSEMARELKVTPGFLSAMETGRKKISEDWVAKVDDFFKNRGKIIPNLKVSADVSNENTSLTGLDFDHQVLVAGFAQSKFTPEELKIIAEFFKNLKGNNA